MDKSLTLVDVDTLISELNFKKDSDSDILLKTLRTFYKANNALSELRSIKSDEIIQQIWPLEGKNTKADKTHLKEKRKLLSAIKSDINKICRDLFWKDKNPERIGIGRFNTFTILRETKYDEVRHLKAEVRYLKTILDDIAPGSLKKVKGDTSMETLFKIREAMSSQKGATTDIEENVIYEKDEKMLEAENKPLSSKDLEITQSVMDIRQDTLNIALKIEEFKNFIINILHNINEKTISHEEGFEKLNVQIIKDKQTLLEDAAIIIQKLSVLDNEDDPILLNAVKLLKATLNKINTEKEQQLNNENLNDSTLSIIRENTEIAKSLNEAGENLSAFAHRVWKKMIASTPKEFLELNKKFEQISEDLTHKREEIEQAQIAKQDLEKEKTKLESLSKTLHSEIETSQETLKKNIENTELVINAREQSLNIAEKLENLNSKALNVSNKVESKEISVTEGNFKLQEINKDVEKISINAKHLAESIKKIDFEEEPYLLEMINGITDNLKNLIEKRNLKAIVNFDKVIEEGLKVIENLDIADETLSRQSSINNETNLKEKFNILKETSKVLLNK
ncbi:MAG: hypothetical protein ACD_79C00307G0001, partial [uncultured bacterium]